MVTAITWRFPQLMLSILSALNTVLWFRYPAMPLVFVLLLLIVQISVIFGSLYFLLGRKNSGAWYGIFLIAMHVGIFGVYFERLLDHLFKPLL